MIDKTLFRILSPFLASTKIQESLDLRPHEDNEIGNGAVRSQLMNLKAINLLKLQQSVVLTQRKVGRTIVFSKTPNHHLGHGVAAAPLSISIIMSFYFNARSCLSGCFGSWCRSVTAMASAFTRLPTSQRTDQTANFTNQWTVEVHQPLGGRA